METLLYTLSMLSASIGLAGTIVRGVPSLIMSIVALMLLFLTPAPPLTVTELFIMIGVATAATLSARLLPPMITKRWGGTNSGYYGAVVGMFAGFMLYPPVGVILAPLFCAIMGEMVNDRSDVGVIFSLGFASFAAFLVGTWIQFVVALWVMWLLINSVFPTLLSQLEAIYSKL